MASIGSLGTLLVNIGANPKAFQAGMGLVEKRAALTTNRLNKLMAVGAGAVALLGIAAFKTALETVAQRW